MDENLKIHALVHTMPKMFNGDWGGMNTRVGQIGCTYWELAYLEYNMIWVAEIRSVLTNVNFERTV